MTEELTAEQVRQKLEEIRDRLQEITRLHKAALLDNDLYLAHAIAKEGEAVAALGYEYTLPVDRPARAGGRVSRSD
jgi:hypothetical protein